MNVNQRKRIDEGVTLREEIAQSRKRKDYLVTIYEAGDSIMAKGVLERMEAPRRSFKVCSLEEISELINSLGAGHWRHPALLNGMSKNKIHTIPFWEKTWGVNYDLHISPLSEECLQQVHDYETSGVLDDWRIRSART